MSNDDDTVLFRHALIKHGVADRNAQVALDSGHPTWDTAALVRDFIVMGFAAPFVIVRRKADNKVGSLMFRHYPRTYYDWKED